MLCVFLVANVFSTKMVAYHFLITWLINLLEAVLLPAEYELDAVSYELYSQIKTQVGRRMDHSPSR